MSSINLVTGTPGAGKSLFLITEVEKLAEKEKRPVYYFGIPGVTLDWIELEDPEKWSDLPDGAIVVFDEAHKVFPPRPSSKKPPRFVEDVAEMRHRGFTFWLATQSPNSLDSFIRDRITRHYFLQRKQGQERATLYQDESLINTRSKFELKQLTGEVWAYPKDSYSKYKSAEVHTVKKRLPAGMWRVYVIIPVLFLAGYAVWNMELVKRMTGRADAPQVTGTAEETGSLPALPFGQQPEEKQNPLKAENYLPASEGLPWTAPIYAQAIDVTTFPKPHCVRSEDSGRCVCYSQQATRLVVALPVCNAIVDAGWFDPTRRESDQEPAQGRARAERPALGRPAAGPSAVVWGQGWTG